MNVRRAVRWASEAAGLLSVLVAHGCGGALVETRPQVAVLRNEIEAVVVLPPRLGFGKLVEQRRAGRRVADFVIEATGGHAILADELPGADPELVTAGIRAMGEEPKRTVVFAMIAARENRAESNAIPGARRAAPIRRYADFTVRLDVRSGETNETIGSVETYSSVYASAPEVDPQGRPLGLAQAAKEAVTEAIRKFAPHLAQPAGPPRFATLVESPPRVSAATPPVKLSASDRLRKLRALYPEVPERDLTALANSQARFLVIAAGTRSAMGLEPHDLVSGTGGKSLGSRAAFARALARGDTPAISVERGGNRFLVGQTQTMIARAPPSSPKSHLP
jgi:hypothetical protein